MKPAPDISVVMAVCNRARYVARAVDSILGQTCLLRENPDFASVSVRCETMDEDGAFIKVTKVRKERQEAGLPLAVLAREAVAVNQTTMFRRSALVAVGGYRSFFTVGEDYDLALRLAEKFGAACINETLYRHRQYAPRGGVNLMSSHAIAPFYCAAVFSAHCRRGGMADPVGEGVTAWDLAPAAGAALPAEIKEICIKNAATDARKLLQKPAPGALEKLLQFMDALAAGHRGQGARSRALRKILFYAVQRGRWWDAGRVVHELASPLRPPEVA